MNTLYVCVFSLSSTIWFRPPSAPFIFCTLGSPFVKFKPYTFSTPVNWYRHQFDANITINHYWINHKKILDLENHKPEALKSSVRITNSRVLSHILPSMVWMHPTWAPWQGARECAPANWKKPHYTHRIQFDWHSSYLHTGVLNLKKLRPLNQGIGMSDGADFSPNTYP